ncbi:membrane protein insertase YidC [Candidatus Avelusimicrobium aviculae]|uniref:membrane protein insertase YidC n=1 Tax=Candidatus Avelusimicrobium aviculae TaxID=3416206 RepID=UPI003D0E577E
MNRQFLTTLMLFLLVITGYNQFVALPRARAEKAAAEEKLKQAVKEQTPAVLATAEGGTSVAAAAASSQPEELISFDYQDADVTFSSKGAGIKKYIYKDVVEDVNLTPFDTKGFFATLPELDFREFSRTQNSITFTGDILPGFEVRKTYTFAENGLNALKVSFVNNTAHDITLEPWTFNFGPGLGTVKSEEKDNERESKAVYLVQYEGRKKATLETLKPKGDNAGVYNPAAEREEEKSADEDEFNWIWAGVQNRYFLSVIIPQDWTPGVLEATASVVGKKDRMWGLFGQADEKGPQMTVQMPSVTVEANSSKEYNSDFYFGPKDYQEFLALPYHLDRSIEFGFFGSLGKIARKVLETFYGWTGNYGVAIILLTVCVQALMFPLTMMSLKSTAQMRKIAPEMKRLQEKYKGNQEALNREMLNLYRKYNVNPLSGCLPMLIQLPIFLALFNALRTSWALHGAGFVGWITDLSSKDPYYVLPILMGVVMFFQQKGNMPPGTDPAQAAMFKYMPLIFTLLFMNFPSGLVLYWLTNSLISFGIQTVVNKQVAKQN